MRKDEFAEKWRDLRPLVKSRWNRLTDDELDQVEGNYDLLVGMIQERYSEPAQAIELELQSIASRVAVSG